MIERPVPETTTDAEPPVNEPFTITFSVPVTGFDVDDLMVENGTASEFEGSGDTYTALITPDGDGTVSVTIAAGAAEDDERNQTAASNTLEVEVDVTAPTPVIASDAERLVTRPFTITVTFDEVVTEFTVDDISAENGTVSDFREVEADSGSVYTALITPPCPSTGPGPSRSPSPRAPPPTRPATPPPAAEPLVVDADTGGPTPVITTSATPPVTGPFRITITFAEPVTWFPIGDLVVTGGTASDFDGEQVEYTALTTPDESGTVTISIPAGAARNEVGYPTRASAAFTIGSDTIPPTATITTTDEVHPPVKESFGITITFSRARHGSSETTT